MTFYQLKGLLPSSLVKLVTVVCVCFRLSEYCFEGSLLTFGILSLLVEFSPADAHMEASTSPELWKHFGHQTSRADPPHGHTRWITDQRGLMLESM